jgi:hypothetical protein
VPLALGGLPFLLTWRGGVCAENADVDVGVDIDAMGVSGDVERELGEEKVGPREAIEESRSLEGTLDWDPVDGRLYVCRKLSSSLDR